MQLLSPENVIGQKARTEGEAKERIRRLREEEAAANLALSQARATLAADTENIAREFAVFEGNMINRREKLTREVTNLEMRRSEAMKPIEEIREAADKRMKDAEKFEDELESDLIALKEREADIVERLIDVKAKEDELEMTIEVLQTREKRLLSEEARVKESLDELAKKWTEYHEAVHESNADLAHREKLVEHDKAVTRQFKYTLDEKAKELDQRKIAIQDGYESLQRARKEILGRSE